MQYMDSADMFYQDQANRESNRRLLAKVEKDIREKGISHCKQFTTVDQARKSFQKHI